MNCYRCGKELDPARFDLERWVVVDGPGDGSVAYVCPECQTIEEWGRAALLSIALEREGHPS